MNILYLCGFYFIPIIFAIKSRPEDDFYHAAVVEYAPLEGVDGNDTLNKNTKEYIRLIQLASDSADIVVFPELGLNYEDNSVFIEIPYGSDTIAPADNSSSHPVLRNISKAARDNQVYVSFTIHEKESSKSSGEILHYNTNVVFDRKGEIVAKYRKYNLFNEPNINVTKVPEVVIFESDFGVRFGMFICFDIIFADPALKLVYEKNVTDIIYPSWWFSELPSLLSIQEQFGWAYRTDTNLLAAGINSVQRSSTGSGIYAGKMGPLVYIFSDKNQTQILTAKVYKKGKSGGGEGKQLEIPNTAVDNDLALWKEDLSFYKTYLLTSLPKNVKSNQLKQNLVLTEMLNKTICQESICCEFQINMTFTYQPQSFLNLSDPSYMKNDSFYHYQYRLAVFDGIRDFHGSKTAGIQICSIIPCLNDSLSSCGMKSGNAVPLMIDSDQFGKMYLSSTVFNTILIKAVSKEKTDCTLPDILESSNSSNLRGFGSLPDVSKMSFSGNMFSSELQFSSDKLIYAGIYSRIISRDGSKPGISSAKTFLPAVMPLIIAIVIMLIFAKGY